MTNEPTSLNRAAQALIEGLIAGDTLRQTEDRLLEVQAEARADANAEIERLREALERLVVPPHTGHGFLENLTLARQALATPHPDSEWVDTIEGVPVNGSGTRVEPTPHPDSKPKVTP